MFSPGQHGVTLGIQSKLSLPSSPPSSASIFCLVRFVLGLSPSSVALGPLSRMLRALYLGPPPLYICSGLSLSLLLSFFRLGHTPRVCEGPALPPEPGVVSAATRSPHLARHRCTIFARPPSPAYREFGLWVPTLFRPP